MKRQMIKWMARISDLRAGNEEGAVAAEYGVLLAGVVAVVTIAAAKLSLKMIFPTVFCVLPVLLIVIVGPSVVRLVHGLPG